MRLRPENLIDFYKSGHIYQYPEGTELVYSNFTPRSYKHATNVLSDYDGKVVFFGLQGVVQWLLRDLWNEEFFCQPKGVVVERYRRRMDSALGPGAVKPDHIAALHDLGYLPIKIKALKEGSRVNTRIPLWTIRNTLPEFYWLTNYLETMLSAETWKVMTSATTAYEYRRLLEKYARITGSDLGFVDWQAHGFEMRGMSGVHDAAQSGVGHLLSFTGTDTIPAIDYAEEYYGANAETELVGGSVPATEHSVMCMGGMDDEVATFRRLVTEVYPVGIVSIVSDTWDFFNVVTNTAATLKDEIMAREGKVVFRPDSGNPVDIICGTYPELISNGTPEQKGAIECLWDTFGGTITKEGYRLLDSHVGVIYGDSITLKIAEDICERLRLKGFASGNVVFGVGSFTYQFVSRDTFGTAIKATFGVVNGEERELYKDPKTDDGVKKSARGLLRVEKENGDYVLYDQQTLEEEAEGLMETVFEDSTLIRHQTLSEIREILRND